MKAKLIISEGDYDTQMEMSCPTMASSSPTIIHISCSDVRMFTLESLWSSAPGFPRCGLGVLPEFFGFLLHSFIIPQT